MQLDIDGTIGQLLQWDLQLTINGMTKATRPLTMANVALLNRAMADPKSVDLVDLLCKLFEGSETEIRNWIEGWSPDRAIAAIVSIAGYLKSVMAKNSPAIAAKIVAAMA